MLRILKDNIFTSKCQTLVNTVNCDGVMGAGIALEFKLRYPEMFVRYREYCENGKLDIGKLWLYKPTKGEPRHWVLSFPTKKHWRDPSKEEYLCAGLQKIVKAYKRKDIESIAFPILGARNGNIEECESVGLMTKYLYKCDIDIDIHEYDPSAKDDLYETLKQVFKEDRSVDQIIKDTSLNAGGVSTIRKALANSGTNSVFQLVSHKGIGTKTMEKVYRFLITHQCVESKFDKHNEINIFVEANAG